MAKDTSTSSVRDPVCGMEVDEKNPPGGSTEYKGKKYYFCTPGCKQRFEKEPEKYAEKEKPKS